MARTNSWNEANPAGSSQASQLDDAMRTLRLDTREVVNQLLGVAEGTSLADPVITPTNTLGGLDTRVDAFEAVQTYTKTIPGICGRVYTASLLPSTLTSNLPAVVLSQVDHGDSYVSFELDLPVGVTVTSITTYCNFSAGGDIAATFRRGRVTGATLVNTTINSTTLNTSAAVVWDVTDTTIVAGDDLYVFMDLNPTAGEIITIYGIQVTYTSPNANVRR